MSALQKSDLRSESRSESRHTYATELTSSQRSALKGQAHALRPLVQVGNNGVTATVAAEIASALQTHELIKVQLPANTDAAEKKLGTDALAEVLPEHTFVVSRIGRTLILYLEKDPKIAKFPLKTLKKLTLKSSM